MTMEEQGGNASVQHTHIQSRQVQAEFLQGSMIDDARMSMPAFPSDVVDTCDGEGTCSCSACRATNNGYRASIWHCDLPLSAWHC